MTIKDRYKREREKLMAQLIKLLALVALHNYRSRDELIELVEKAYDEENR